MKNIRLDIEYDGTDFAGWAKQPGLPTIEGALEDTLGRILQRTVSLSVAGRTDAGVHARGQVANFQIEPTAGLGLETGDGDPAEQDIIDAAAGDHTERDDIDTGKLRRSANQLLPEGIVIKSVSLAVADFDARFSAVSRSYSYRVLNRAYPSPFRGRYHNYFPGQLDFELLSDAARLIRGLHDFTAFTPTVTEHNSFQREITRSEWQRDGDLLIYSITAPGFLRNMVRVLVGTMLEIGRGYRPIGDLPPLLEGAARPAAGRTAPPQGLCLEVVEYKSA